MRAGYAMLMAAMDEIEGIFTELKNSNREGDEAYRFAFAGFRKFFQRELSSRGIHLTPEEEKILDLDVDLNAQGLAFAAQRARKKGKAN